MAGNLQEEIQTMLEKRLILERTGSFKKIKKQKRKKERRIIDSKHLEQKNIKINTDRWI